jgi:Pyruvate/2-oxoacid:ferredoxin oxidoreductase delta subunit
MGAVMTKSSMEYETGDWGVEKPQIDLEKCTQCTLCHYFCPEGAITEWRRIGSLRHETG